MKNDRLRSVEPASTRQSGPSAAREKSGWSASLRHVGQFRNEEYFV